MLVSLKFIGILGASLLAFCGAPQAWLAYKNGHSNGQHPWYLIMWLVGVVCMCTYSTFVLGFSWIVFFNYLFSFIFCAIITYYYFFPRNK